MTTNKNHGLARVQEIYYNRDQRVKYLKANGKKIMGYVCLYPVTELVTAAGMVPYRIFGDMTEPITKADVHMASVVCPFMRSCLDIGMKGRYDFLDGMLFAHVCDVACMLPGMWRQSVPTPFTHFLDTPHTTHKSAREHFRALVGDFRKILEEYIGQPISNELIIQAIALHNQQRALVRELYELKKNDPPTISGVDTLKVMIALMSLPIAEGNTLLKEVLVEVNNQLSATVKKPARLLVWGSVIDDTALFEMIENLEAYVVIDDTCVGSRAYFSDVPVTSDPLDGLSEYYLVTLKCPRTLHDPVLDGNKKDYQGDLENRFGYLKQYVMDWRVNGAVLQSIRYCDCHGYEVPSVKDYLESLGIPAIYIEHDYSKAALAPLQTRIQGLTEIIR
jgi:benzoyl-CoA reductase subunit C